MKIAIFADIHGKILLPFRMVEAYQEQYGEKIDLILQCGDMGTFPDPNKMDKATIKHAKRDRQELGFSDFFVRTNPIIRDYLERLDIDMICVRGNHEDHDYLDELEQQYTTDMFPIDVYKRIYVCKSGAHIHLDLNGEDLDFMGIGRIGDRKGRNEKRFIQDYERKNINKAIKNGKKLDILLSHDIPADMTEPGFGMEELRPVLDRLKPVAHFHGHTGKPYKIETDLNNYTQLVKIKELEFTNTGFLPEKCMFILDKVDGVIEGDPVDNNFIFQFHKDTWQL